MYSSTRVPSTSAPGLTCVCTNGTREKSISYLGFLNLDLTDCAQLVPIWFNKWTTRSIFYVAAELGILCRISAADSECQEQMSQSEEMEKLFKVNDLLVKIQQAITCFTVIDHSFCYTVKSMFG